MSFESASFARLADSPRSSHEWAPGHRRRSVLNASRRTQHNQPNCPRWSPDGRFIVASAIEGNRLLLYEVATGHWRDLSRFSGQYGYFDWSRDSKYVYYDTTMVKEPELARVRVADGRVEHITSLKDVRRFWGPWGPWAGITADGSPLIVRDISNQEIYALDLNLP